MDLNCDLFQETVLDLVLDLVTAYLVCRHLQRCDITSMACMNDAK